MSRSVMNYEGNSYMTNRLLNIFVHNFLAILGSENPPRPDFGMP